MRCPDCDAEIILGQDNCESCGSDLTFLSAPGPKEGRLHELILEDPLSQLNAPAPILLKGSDSVEKAIQQMRKQRYGSVIVADDAGALSGIFTERDALIRLQHGETPLAKTRIADVMTKQPHSLKGTDTIAQALNLMAVGGYRHLPIVHDGQPVGFCSIRGILRYISQNALEG